jgi:hypothetical protein
MNSNFESSPNVMAGGNMGAGSGIGIKKAS